ncbi:MAG: polysaccharide export protein [Sphingomonadales bacterium]|nr:polysaccharide export protein [Sphingomonadales bacterium]
MQYSLKTKAILGMAAIVLTLSGCSGLGGSNLPEAPLSASQVQRGSEEYLIGPLDTLTIFVWRNPELGAKVQVRPDGRITTPLITDMPAAGKTSTMLAQDIKLQLSQFINEPIVSVIVNDFQGGSQNIRILGATEKPASIPYRANITVLDAIIAVGGLSEFASGNRARLIRVNRATGRQQEYALRLGDLLKRGDSRANVQLQPGDVIIIPESAF